MPKRYSSREIERTLVALGFSFISQSGSHGKFRSQDGRSVIVPMNKREIPVGTFKSIMKQASISQEDMDGLQK